MMVKKNTDLARAEALFLQGYRESQLRFAVPASDIEDFDDKTASNVMGNLDGAVSNINALLAGSDRMKAIEADQGRWLLLQDKDGSHSFQLRSILHVIPRSDMLEIKIPDATPEIVDVYAVDRRQKLLAHVRYNRLADLFLGVVTSSLQSFNQSEASRNSGVNIDEIYVGIDKRGVHFVVPVIYISDPEFSAVVDLDAIIEFCSEKFPKLELRIVTCCPIRENVISMIELCKANGKARIVSDSHYQLVPSWAGSVIGSS